MRISTALFIYTLPALVAAEISVHKLHIPPSLRKRSPEYDTPSRVIDKDIKKLINSLTLKEKM